MKASVRADMLLDVLRRALYAFPAKADKPELNKVLVRFQPFGQVAATCTDGAFFATAWCAADVEEDGEALFNREQIWEYLSAQSDQIVEFETKRKPGKYSGKIAISGVDQAEVKIWSGEFYPAVLAPPETTGSFHVTDTDLATLLVAGEAATPSAEKNITSLTRNVSVYQVDHAVYLATWAVRQSVVRSTGYGIPEGGILCPLRYLNLAKKATSSDAVGISGTKLVMSSESAWASFPTEGDAQAINPDKYINFPGEPNAVLHFEGDLMSVLHLCRVFGKQEGDDYVSASFKYDPEGFMDISACVGMFQGRRMATTPGQEPFEELFHAGYVYDALSDLGAGAEVQILTSPKGKWARVVQGNRYHIFMSMAPPKKGR